MPDYATNPRVMPGAAATHRELDEPIAAAAPVSIPTAEPFVFKWKKHGLRTVWIYLSGELDASAAPHFRKTMRQAQSTAVIGLVDLRHLTFIDCAALGILVDADRYARRTKKSLVLLRGSGQVDRMLTLTGLITEFEIVDLQAVEVTGRAPIQSPTRNRSPRSRTRGTTVTNLNDAYSSIARR